MTIKSDINLTSSKVTPNTPFTSLINTDTKFSLDEKHKLSTFNEGSYVSKLAKVTTQALNNQVNKTQDAVTKPSSTPTSGPVQSASPNEKLIAGRILAEARAASKGISPTVNNINIATGAINELSKLKESSNIYQKASQTEKDGKVTDNMTTLIEGGQKVAQGVIDLMTPLLKGSPGVSITGNDTVNLGANRGISINSRGSISHISPQYNVHASLNTTTSEVSVEKVGLKSQESETRVNSTTNNIDKSTNNVQLHSSVETVSNNYTLYSKDVIQTVTSNKLDSFVKGETQGNDMKYSIDNNMLYTVGENFTLGVGDAPSNGKKPGFGIGEILDSTIGSVGGKGSLLSITPSSYSLQQKGKVSVQSSGSQSHIATKISNIASQKVVNLSKQDVLSVALGTEFRVGMSTGFSTFMGFGSTVIGNFNIIGNLMGFVSGISELAGLIFPDLGLGDLNIPTRSEKVSLEGKIKFDECLPTGLNKKKPSTTNLGTTTLSPSSADTMVSGSEADDLPEYKDQEILDKLQETYPEAGGLQLNKPKGKAMVEAITPETDTPLGIKSLPQTADPLQQPSTPHNTSIVSKEASPNAAGLLTPNSIESTPSNKVGGSAPNTISGLGGLLGGISAQSLNPNATPESSTTSSGSNVVLDKKPKSNPQPGVPKNPSSNTISNSIKARYAPHTYIDIYKEEDYFQDLKGSTPSNPTKPQPSTPPSIQDYISKSTNLNPEQKQKIGNNLKAITDALSSETSTTKLSTAISTKVKGLSETEVKEVVDSYIELNASMAVGFGFLGDIGAFFGEVTSIVTEVYEQVDKAASVFGVDINGGAITSVMDIVNKVKSASNTSSISELLGSLGTDFDEFMPITTSLLGLMDGSKTKEDVVGSLSTSLSGVISPLLKNIGMNSLITDTLLGAVSDVITNGTIMNRDKGDILNRLVSVLSTNGIVPAKAFEVANSLGNVIDGIQDGSLMPSLLGSGVNTLFSTLNNSIDLGPVNKVLKNINSIYGTVESLMAIPSMLEAMNDYDIPLLSQISSILDCVDVFSRLKDIVGIVKDPLGYEPKHTDSSLNLPTDLSINKLKDVLSEKVIGKDTKVGQAITSGGTLDDFLSDIRTDSSGLGKTLNRFVGDDSFFLVPPGSKAYLASGEEIDSGKFLVNTKGDVLVTSKDDVCKLEDISLVSNKEVVALDLSSMGKDGKKGGVLKSLTTSVSTKYLPEYKDKDAINKALQVGDLEPIATKDKETNTPYAVDIGIKNNPELLTQLTNKASALHLRDSYSKEEFIWSELTPESIPGFVPKKDIGLDKPRTQKPIQQDSVRGSVQHSKGVCRASIPELFHMIDKTQGLSSSTILLRTNQQEVNTTRSAIELLEDRLLVNGKRVLLGSLHHIELNHKGYKLLVWDKN